jgi:hypothetical protein
MSTAELTLELPDEQATDEPRRSLGTSSFLKPQSLLTISGLNNQPGFSHLPARGPWRW